MSDYQEKPNNGKLFPNKNKTNPNQPDFTGKIVVDIETVKELVRRHGSGRPVEIDVSGWKKTGPKTQYLSVQIKPAWEKTPSQPQPANNSTQGGWQDDDDSDLPF